MYDTQRRARCEAWCKERDGSGDGEEWFDDAVAVITNTENREKQARDVSETEWRSTGRPGGADGVKRRRTFRAVLVSNTTRFYSGRIRKKSI